MGKKERDELKRRIKGVPGNYVQNQKYQVFEDRRTKRRRTRGVKNTDAIQDSLMSDPPQQELPNNF
jgi:hypothetical protein